MENYSEVLCGGGGRVEESQSLDSRWSRDFVTERSGGWILYVVVDGEKG